MNEELDETVMATRPDPINVQSNQSSVVLLVDDNPLNLRILFESLGDAGFRLLVAESGEAALEQVARLKPDIILLDVMMPGLSGFDTCRRLKDDPTTADIPVVFMTALADTDYKIQGLSVGAVDYITKPIQPEEVLARVKTHLTVHHLQQQLQQQNAQLKQEILERQQIEQSLRLLHRSVSHDLKNPVNGMIMVLNNLLNGIGTVPLDAIEQSQSGHSHVTQSRSSQPHVERSQARPLQSAQAQANGTEYVVVPRKTLERMVKSSDRQLQLINSLLETHAVLPHATSDPDSSPPLSTDPFTNGSQTSSPVLPNGSTPPSPMGSPAPLTHGTNGLASTPTVLELHRQPIRVADLLDGIYQDIQPLLRDHPAHLTYDIADQLPLVYADPTQIWRVLENLVTNAIKHNPPGVEVAIAIHPHDQPTSARLDSGTVPEPPTPPAPFSTCTLKCEVRDNGVGIPISEQATLFDPYQRGEDVQQTPGLGLGLYLCRQIIERHGGAIGVTSQPQSGTIFWFTMPCVEPCEG